MINSKDNYNIKNLLLVSFDDIINLNDYMEKDIFHFNNKNSIYFKIINNIYIVNDEIYILLVLNIISNNIKKMEITQIYNSIQNNLEHIISQIILNFKIKGDPDYIIRKYKIKCIYYTLMFSTYKNNHVNNKILFENKLDSLNIKDNIKRLFTPSINNKELFLKVINKLYHHKYNLFNNTDN
jgi:hypothetical protein